MRKWISLFLACMLMGCPGSQPVTDNRPLSKEPPQPIAVKPFSFGQPQIVLMVTGGGNGIMEVCNCSGPMPGGLSRRSGMVISYRNAFPNTVVLDAGDAFWRSGEHTVNEFVLEGFRQIGYDAMVLGDQEWSLPAGPLRKTLLPGKMEYLSSTVSDGAMSGGQSGPPLVKVIKREFGGAKLAIVSDLRPQWKLLWPADRKGQLQFAQEWDLPAQIDQLHQARYVVGVVCHGDDDAIKETAASCNADFFIHGHKSRTLDKLDNINGRPVLNARGADHVSVLGIQLKPDGTIANLEFRLERVDKPWPIDDRLLQTYKDYTQVAMKAALNTAPRPGLEYASSDQCSACHKAQFKHWSQSKHSTAYQTLLRVKRAGDPACVGCHTSGFGTTKGFSTIDSTPQLAGVNCQDCHQMDFSSHKNDRAKSPPPTAATCKACHTEVTSPQFVFAKQVDKIRCPLGKPKGAVAALPGH